SRRSSLVASPRSEARRLVRRSPPPFMSHPLRRGHGAPAPHPAPPRRGGGESRQYFPPPNSCECPTRSRRFPHPQARHAESSVALCHSWLPRRSHPPSNSLIRDDPVVIRVTSAIPCRSGSPAWYGDSCSEVAISPTSLPTLSICAVV